MASVGSHPDFHRFIMASDAPAHHRITYHSTPLAGTRWFAPTVVHLHSHEGSTAADGARPSTGRVAGSAATHPLTHGDTAVYNARKARKGRYQPREHRLHHAGLAEVLRSRESSRPSSSAGPSSSESASPGVEKSPSRAPSFLGLASIRARRPGQSRIKPHLNADVSFWIAILFTAGSMVWCVNGEWSSSEQWSGGGSGTRRRRAHLGFRKSDVLGGAHPCILQASSSSSPSTCHLSTLLYTSRQLLRQRF